jgi:hypothetical protein
MFHALHVLINIPNIYFIYLIILKIYIYIYIFIIWQAGPDENGAIWAVGILQSGPIYF